MFRTLKTVASAAILSLTLSGCVSLSDFFASFGLGDSEPEIGLPKYKVGDSFTFGSPEVTWRVVGLESGRVTWRSDLGDEQVTGRNPLLPALAWQSERNGSGQRIISDKRGSLFPMKVGARTTFRAAVTTDKPPYGWGFDWQCEVLDRQKIGGPQGVVDAFKVGCGRDSVSEMVFFYAPSIGHYITKSKHDHGGETSRVKHLVAYERLNEGGTLERVAFAGYLADSTSQPLNKEAHSVRKGNETTSVVAAVPIASNNQAADSEESRLQAHARQLLAQKKSIGSVSGKPAVAARLESAAVEKAEENAPQLNAVSPASGRPLAKASPQAERTTYRLVANTIPNFPPRPKFNPARKDRDFAIPTDPINEPSVIHAPKATAVAAVPVFKEDAESEKFTVSIVRKAHASADRSRESIREARKKALQAPGLGDEAILAVKTARRQSESASQVSQDTVKAVPMQRKASQSRVAALAPNKSPPPPKSVEKDKFYGVHLGTFLDPKKALRGWKHIYRSHERLLSGLQPRIRRHDLGERGSRYRLRVVPFVDERSANLLCKRLAERGKFCRVTVE